MHISDQQLDTYRKQGFLIVENFLTEEERRAALDGFFSLFAPAYQDYAAAGRNNHTPQQQLFPWDHSGLNHVTVHPDLISAAERVLGTREIKLDEGHLGMKYAGEQHLTDFHVDYGNNTLGPIIEPDDFMHLACFYCFDDVDAGLAPIRMVPNGRPDEEFVPMIVPGGSVCLYSIYTRHAASDFTAAHGHRPAMWVGFTRKDRPWGRGPYLHLQERCDAGSDAPVHGRGNSAAAGAARVPAAGRLAVEREVHRGHGGPATPASTRPPTTPPARTELTDGCALPMSDGTIGCSGLRPCGRPAASQREWLLT